MTEATRKRLSVRELGPNDLDELISWRMEVLDTVFAEDKPWDAEALREANLGYYREHIGKDHFACIISVDGKDAGCGAICIQDEMPSPDNPTGKNAYLMNIYTREEFRHKGVGEAVVAWLIDRARAEGADKIYLESTDMAKSLYSKIGFAPMHGMMKLQNM